MTNSVKLATSADITELIELMAEFHGESGYGLNKDIARRAFSELIEDPKLGQVWLLQQDNRVAGYIVLTVCFSMEYGGRAAFIDDLFVRSEFRRLGLGRCAMEALISECRSRGVIAVHVEVGRSNQTAKKLYAKFGLRDHDIDRQLLTVRLKEQTTAL
jgi:ribosomal protein S18 acetylase RimI-like enzyme